MSFSWLKTANICQHETRTDLTVMDKIHIHTDHPVLIPQRVVPSLAMKAIRSQQQQQRQQQQQQQQQEEEEQQKQQQPTTNNNNNRQTVTVRNAL
jgi:mannitol-specific phosphotransferase system IIBC component